MKRSIIRGALIVFALFALYTASLGIVPSAEAAPGLVASKLDPALVQAMKANPKGEFAVIVQSAMPNLKATPDPKGLPNLKDMRNAKGVFDKKDAVKVLNAQRSTWLRQRVVAFAGKKLNNLALIGGAAATLNVNAIVRLIADPYVTYIRLDRRIVPMGTPGELSLYTQIVQATDVWAQGFNGQGIGVAIIDSGVAPVDDVSLPASRIVATVDFTDAPAAGDPGGHGTHVAGIVAGNGTDSATSRMGVAPGANIINVRVIGADGTASMSSVIRGIEWVINNRATYNIRVMNLSLGATTTTGYQDDPLASAVELAWHSGIVVVTAAGNGLNVPGTIVTPGIDPFVITVGALDDHGNVPTADDQVASFSSFGPTLDGLSKPDLVAPGRQIVSLRALGSYLDNLLPDRRTDTNYFRLSGTSMSAPVVAGSVALMLQKNPTLTPNQIKYILTHTTQPVVLSPGANVSGAGLVNAFAAANSTLNAEANQGVRPSDDFCAAVYPMLYGMPLTGMWKDLNYQGIDWANISWDNISWDNISWDNISWDNISWDNITWSNISWDNISWDNISWDASAASGSSQSGTWASLGKLN